MSVMPRMTSSTPTSIPTNQSEIAGQPWKSTTHIDCVGRNFDIWLDDEQVMAKGKFLL